MPKPEEWLPLGKIEMNSLSSLGVSAFSKVFLMSTGEGDNKTYLKKFFKVPSQHDSVVEC